MKILLCCSRIVQNEVDVQWRRKSSGLEVKQSLVLLSFSVESRPVFSSELLSRPFRRRFCSAVACCRERGGAAVAVEFCRSLSFLSSQMVPRIKWIGGLAGALRCAVVLTGAAANLAMLVQSQETPM